MNLNVSAPTKLKPGDLLEALEFNESLLRDKLTNQFDPKEWVFSCTEQESPATERMIRTLGIFSLSLERLSACDVPPHFKLRQSPCLWKVYRGKLEIGVAELPPSGHVQVSARFQLGIDSSFETLLSKEYCYLRPLTNEVLLAKIWMTKTKFVEPPVWTVMSTTQQEKLKKEFIRIYL